MKANCLNCKREIPVVEGDQSGLYSCSCGATIPYTLGIYQFCQTDDFYEGKFVSTHTTVKGRHTLIKKAQQLFSIDGNEDRMWEKSKKYILNNSNGLPMNILNIGAGGGHDFLNQIGSVTAVDLSVSSLLNSKSIYEVCYQADAMNLPFADNSFDLVFSAHLLGHIPLGDKQAVIRELYRVTKKGGFSLHSAECEGKNWVYKRAKKYPQQYKKYFQDMYGHYGLEFPSLCKQRFKDEGFCPIFEASDYCKGVIRPVDSYAVFFGEPEYQSKDPLLKFLAVSSKALSRNKYIKFVVGICLYPLTILNRINGPDAVDSVKLLYKKS